MQVYIRSVYADVESYTEYYNKFNKTKTVYHHCHVSAGIQRLMRNYTKVIAMIQIIKRRDG